MVIFGNSSCLYPTLALYELIWNLYLNDKIINVSYNLLIRFILLNFSPVYT